MKSGKFAGLLALICILAWAVAATAIAEEPKGMGGWEKGSEYNKLYNPAELEKFRATVTDIMEVEPMPGMSPAVALEIKESPEDEPILVHICPTWFAGTEDIGLRKGDRIKIRGAWAEIGGKDVFMASKIKKGDFFVFKVRLTKDGTPFWTMTPEQLAREQQGD